jgi:hypothetical protein
MEIIEGGLHLVPAGKRAEAIVEVQKWEKGRP